MRKILVIGACGQIGSDLVIELRRIYGGDNVIASYDRTKPSEKLISSGPIEHIDVTNKEKVEAVDDRHGIDTIYHMTAMPSAMGENNPQLCWRINIDGLRNILEIAKEYELERVFYPSSITVFGSRALCVDTPQDSVLYPTTIYMEALVILSCKLT